MTGPRISGTTRIAGVCGRPVAHSLSPLIHNEWIRAASIDAVYVPFAPPVSRFLPFIEGLRGGVVTGLNVTAPFKETACLLADRRTAAAEAAGAANLLLFHPDGAAEADNTDGLGLLYALRRQAPDLDLASTPVAILGAGGAARGAVHALVKAGVTDIRLINRSLARAETLAAQAPGVRAVTLEHRRRGLSGARLIINATPADAVVSLRDDDFAVLSDGAAAMDMVYRPLNTPFLQAAARRGCVIVDGLEMLIGQAIPSFRRFFDVDPPDPAVARAAALSVLGST